MRNNICLFDRENNIFPRIPLVDFAYVPLARLGPMGAMESGKGSISVFIFYRGVESWKRRLGMAGRF